MFAGNYGCAEADRDKMNNWQLEILTLATFLLHVGYVLLVACQSEQQAGDFLVFKKKIVTLSKKDRNGTDFHSSQYSRFLLPAVQINQRSRKNTINVLSDYRKSRWDNCKKNSRK